MGNRLYRQKVQIMQSLHSILLVTYEYVGRHAQQRF